jgi:hypothetical protein
MTSNISHIKNPLTVIAIFAGLAEVGGTIVLPLLEKETQTTYVWFLMLFPPFLVGLFFYVLYTRHKVLYAPSDFKDDSSFHQTFLNASELHHKPTPSCGNPQATPDRNTPPVGSGNDNTGAPVETPDSSSNRNLEQGTYDGSIPNALPPKPFSFDALSAEKRKLLKTLWKFQCEYFTDDRAKRWGFKSDDWQIRLSALSLKIEGIITSDDREFWFLTDKGIAFCEANSHKLQMETEFYSNFSN